MFGILGLSPFKMNFTAPESMPNHFKVTNYPPHKFKNENLKPTDCLDCNGHGRVQPWGCDHYDDCMKCRGTGKREI